MNGAVYIHSSQITGNTAIAGIPAEGGFGPQGFGGAGPDGFSLAGGIDVSSLNGLIVAKSANTVVTSNHAEYYPDIAGPIVTF